MQANSETKFLNTILLTYGYRPYVQNCDEFLASLCQDGNHQAFLEICRKLFDVIIPSLFRPAHRLPDDVLETVAGDLNTILLLLWKLQGYSKLVNYVFDAQNMASNAYGEKSKKARVNYIKSCIESLNEASQHLGEFLEEDA